MAFRQIVMVVNRTTVPLEVTENGQVWVIRPGYKQDENGNIIGAGVAGTPFQEPLPYFVAERAVRRNPIMGTMDPLTPGRALSLIGVPEWNQDYSHIEQSEAIEILDRTDLPEAEVVRVVGGRKTVSIPGLPRQREKVPQRTADLVDARLENPTGLDMRQ